MSYIVDVELLVKQAGQTNTQLSKTIKQLEEIQKKSKIDLKIDNNAIKATTASVKGLDNSLKGLHKTTTESSKSAQNLAGAYIGLRKAMQMKQFVGASITELRAIDKAMFDLGVVAGKTAEQIDIMKFEFIDMAREVPVSAISIANAVDILARSGLDYETSVKGINSAIQLAVASGEKLENVSGIISKALVAFKLDMNSASESVDKFHSVVLGTPLSLEGLGQGLKNSASAFSSLISFSNKSGEALTEYKEDLLELNSAMIGSSVSIGLSASQSGTFIRGFVSRLVSAEKTAVKLFDGLNLQFEGSTLTFRKFSEIASQDVFKALDILGENFDKLSQNKDVLKAMFTQRQFVRAIPILKQISELTGQSDSATRAWMETYTTGRSTINDYNTQQENLNNQLIIFDNNITAVKKSIFELIEGMSGELIPIANEWMKALSDSDDVVGKTTVQILALTSAFTALAVGLNALGAIGVGTFIATTLSNPAILASVAIASTIAGITVAVNNTRKAREKELETVKEQRRSIIKMRSDNEKLLDSLEDSYSEMEKGTYNINTNWKTNIDLMEKAISSSKELQGLYTSMSDLSKLSTLDISGAFDDLISGYSKIENLIGRKSFLENDIENFKKWSEEKDKLEAELKEIKKWGISKEEKPRADELKDRIQTLYNFMSSAKDSSKELLDTELKLETVRANTLEQLKEAKEKALEYGIAVDLAGQNLEASHRSIQEFIVSQKDMSEFETFKQYEKFLKEYSPSMLAVFDELENFSGDKLVLANTKLFNSLAPIIAGLREHVIETTNSLKLNEDILATKKEELQDTNDMIKSAKDSGDINEKDLDILKKRKIIQESTVNSLEEKIKDEKESIATSEKQIDLASDLLVNSKEYNEELEKKNKLYSETVENFLPKTIDQLNETYKIDELIGLTGQEKINKEKELLGVEQARLKLKMSGYVGEVAKLEEIKAKGTFDETTGTFTGADKNAVKKLNEEYKAQVKIVEGYYEIAEAIVDIQNKINKNKEDQIDYDEDLIDKNKQRVDTYNKLIKSSRDEVKNIQDLIFQSEIAGLSEKEQEKAIRERNIARMEEISNVIDIKSLTEEITKMDEETLSLLEKSDDLSDDELKKIQEEYNLTKDQLDLLKEYLTLLGIINKKRKEGLDDTEKQKQILSQISGIAGQLGIEGAGGIFGGISALMGTEEKGSLIDQLVGGFDPEDILGSLIPGLEIFSAGVSIFQGATELFGQIFGKGSEKIDEAGDKFLGSAGEIANFEYGLENLEQIGRDFAEETTAEMWHIIGVNETIKGLVESLDVMPGQLADSIKGAFSAETFDQFAEDIGNTITGKLKSGLTDVFLAGLFEDTFKPLTMDLTSAILAGENITSAQIAGLNAQISTITNQAMPLFNTLGMLDFNQEVEYKDVTSDITYETGTSAVSNYNYYITNTVSIQDSIGFSEDAGFAIAEALEPFSEVIREKR